MPAMDLDDAPPDAPSADPLADLAQVQRRTQAAFAEQVLAQQTLEAPLAQFLRGLPLAVPPATPLRDALQQMHTRGVGSVLVVDGEGDGAGVVRGILTRHDLLARVVLPGTDLAAPIARVMSAPVHTLDAARSAHDAALLMSREGVRHVPITQQGRLAGIVSERDLFTLQRLSLRQIGDALRAAGDVATLQEAAADIRRFAAQLFAQGVQARNITELVSQLNDALTARLVALLAQAHGLDLGQACWLAFGSEGRGEQTVATDQDNGLVLADAAEADLPRWLALGQAVNQALADCGYPLCSGGVMAGNPDCCRTVAGWHARFGQWIAHGAPQDLLAASIYFDLRPIAGNAALAAPLSALVVQQAAATPRFLSQLAVNALQHRPPLHWHGGIDTQRIDGHDVIDLKLQGSALFVEAARVLALATGVAATGTRQRLEGAAAALGVPATEAQAWVAAFEHLQLLRLRVQVAGDTPHPNRCQVDTLDLLERRVLRESLRVARGLQQRVALDWQR